MHKVKVLLHKKVNKIEINDVLIVICFERNHWEIGSLKLTQKWFPILNFRDLQVYFPYYFSNVSEN